MRPSDIEKNSLQNSKGKNAQAPRWPRPPLDKSRAANYPIPFALCIPLTPGHPSRQISPRIQSCHFPIHPGWNCIAGHSGKINKREDRGWPKPFHTNISRGYYLHPPEMPGRAALTDTCPRGKTHLKLIWDVRTPPGGLVSSSPPQAGIRGD